MINDLIFVYWFFAPAGVANVAAFFSGKIPLLADFTTSADFGKKFRGRRILGDHKTLRGFIFGTICAILIVYLQIFLYTNISFIKAAIHLDYGSINPIFLGSLLGFGALFGDSVKSFFKRQIGISPGKSWFPFDQVDYILGGIFFASFYIRLSLSEYFFLFIVWFLIHPLSTLIGYILKLKEEPL